MCVGFDPLPCSLALCGVFAVPFWGWLGDLFVFLMFSNTVLLEYFGAKALVLASSSDDATRNRHSIIIHSSPLSLLLGICITPCAR
jgi:hypothetical protein